MVQQDLPDERDAEGSIPIEDEVIAEPAHPSP